MKNSNALISAWKKAGRVLFGKRGAHAHMDTKLGNHVVVFFQSRLII